VWLATNPAAHGGLITLEDIEYDRKTLGSKFIVEGLGAWPKEKDDAGWEVFAEDAWKHAQDPDTKFSGRPVFCFEVSRDLTTISIGAAGIRGDGLRHLELIDRFPADAGRAVGWLKKRIKMWDPAAVVVDSAGPAAMLIPEFERNIPGLEVLKPLARDVAAACSSIYVGISGPDIEARDVRVRPHPALDAAARVAVWRDRGDAKAFDRRNDDGPDVAPLMATALADWAVSIQPEPEQQFFASWR
jgi:hypothetical protein